MQRGFDIFHPFEVGDGRMHEVLALALALVLVASAQQLGALQIACAILRFSPWYILNWCYLCGLPKTELHMDGMLQV